MQRDLGVAPLVAVVVLSPVLGDTVGYEVGKHLGPRFLQLRPLRGQGPRLEKAQETLRRRGGPAVFAARWTAFLRAVMPGLAGLSRMRYRTFLMWNALGRLAWGTTFALIGYFVGASYQKVATTVGRDSAVVLAMLVVLGAVVWHVRRRRSEERTP